MTTDVDFERLWLGKLGDCVADVAGAAVREAVMAGSAGLSDQSSREAVIAWSQGAMERLEALVEDEGQRREIMTGCACHYPVADLQDVRTVYAETGDLERVHGMLQARFEAFLRQGLRLPESMVEEVVGRGWGVAGILQGDMVLATKIPKSGFLVQYLEETDAERRRQIYCHCPRVRDALGLGEGLSSTYCYCGAGFYQGIWEEILQRPVQVEVVESVLAGGEVCTIAVHLPVAG